MSLVPHHAIYFASSNALLGLPCRSHQLATPIGAATAANLDLFADSGRKDAIRYSEPPIRPLESCGDTQYPLTLRVT